MSNYHPNNNNKKGNKDKTSNKLMDNNSKLMDKQLRMMNNKVMTLKTKTKKINRKMKMMKMKTKMKMSKKATLTNSQSSHKRIIKNNLINNNHKLNKIHKRRENLTLSNEPNISCTVN